MNELLTFGHWFYAAIVVYLLVIIITSYFEEKRRRWNERFEKTKEKLHKEAQEKFYYFMTLPEMISALHREKLSEYESLRRREMDTKDIMYELQVLGAESQRLWEEARRNKEAILELETGFDIKTSARA